MTTDPKENENKGNDRQKGYAHDDSLNEDEIAGNPTGVGENDELHDTQWDNEEPEEDDL